MDGNNYPKLHNAMWPGLVGKGPDSEPPIDLDTMLNLTAAARADGVKFEGVDLFLADPHTSIDSSKDDIGRLADKISGFGLAVGSVVAPVWPPMGGGSAMGGARSARNSSQGREGLPHRPPAARTRRPAILASSGSTRRPASTTGPRSRTSNQKAIAETFREACDIAEDMASASPPKAKSAGAACTAGSTWSSFSRWSTGRKRSASRPTWRTRSSTRSATTRPNTAFCRRTSTGRTRARSTMPTRSSPHALRPWTIDFHVAQNDATVKGSGSHDKTGRHCLVGDPNGKLDITRHAGYWLRDDNGK